MQRYARPLLVIQTFIDFGLINAAFARPSAGGAASRTWSASPSIPTI